MERRLAAASKLIVGLASERTRWTADMQAAPASLLHRTARAACPHVRLLSAMSAGRA